MLIVLSKNMDIDSLLPTFPIDTIQRHSRIGIVAPKNAGGAYLGQVLAEQKELMGAGHGKISVSSQSIDAKYPEWEEELEASLQAEFWEEHNTTVLVKNLSKWYSLTLGRALINCVYYGLSFVLQFKADGNCALPWFEELDYVFARQLDDYHKRLVWLRISRPFKDGPLFSQLRFEQFSALLDRYSEGTGWLIINLRQNSQFREPLYRIAGWQEQLIAIDEDEPSAEVCQQAESIELVSEPTPPAEKSVSIASWLWSWIPSWY